MKIASRKNPATLTAREITKLKNDYKYAIDSASRRFNNVLETNLIKEAHSNYRGMLRALEVDLKHNITGESLTRLTPAMIKKEINKSIGGRTIEQRLKLNARNLYQDATKALQKDILEAIKEHQAKGHSIDKMTRTIKGQLHTDTYKARRIARTESHRMREFSTWEAQTEAQKYEMFKREWLATMDMRTRPEHLALGGKFEGEDGRFHSGEWAAYYPGGFGVAKMDIHCRCSVVANFDGVMGDDNFIRHGSNSQETWENDILDIHSRYNKDKLIMETLDPKLYPFDVATGVSADMEQYMDLSIGEFEMRLKMAIRDNYFSYLEAEYSFMDIKLIASKNLDPLYLARQQKIFKNLAEAYPEGASKINTLMYTNDPTSNSIGYMQPYRGTLNINTHFIGESPADAIKQGWFTPCDLEFTQTDRALVHEYGHWVDWQGEGWSSKGLRKPSTMTGYGTTNNQEAFAESFVNAVTAETPDPVKVKFIEKATGKKIKEVKNLNLEVLT